MFHHKKKTTTIAPTESTTLPSSRPSSTSTTHHTTTTEEPTSTTMMPTSRPTQGHTIPTKPTLPPTTSTSQTVTTKDPITTQTITSTTIHGLYPTPAPIPIPTYHHNGYYYHGNPQNVSHVEFTTPTTVTITHFAPIKAPGQVNHYQQVPDLMNNFDFDGQSALERIEYYNQFENNREGGYNKNDNYLYNNNKNVEGLNGFKPSMPYNF